ncbi:hypothetical protein HID58_009331 [Brassica napus]|uniref:Protein kinase domain-containing protein n=3 Tax=Brassica TaxID=3705 RepID=A0ABQ8DS68_BRANA|nr:hypothetical protein HID58_009331 [Brassica napus]
MEGESFGLIVGISLGVVIGVLLAISAFFCFRYHRKTSQIVNSGGGGSSRRSATLPIRENGANSCNIMSDSTLGPDSPVRSSSNGRSGWLDGFSKKTSVISASGILEYSYRDLQKATCNFTSLIGQGAFGPVFKAQMSTGETVAVKVLATDSKQGEKEFQTEVMLLGRLHHRNLVNLVGYCAEKGQHMLIYVYMSKGSLASHLYSEKHEPLSWDLRVYIALDVARGLEYLHDGAVPPVIHRDIKSSNILLDQSMRARVADFGLSREEMVDKHAANIRGTFGYLDPEYISTRTFTKKSDVYGFGVLLFELIAARNPQQGLMEYVELAAMNAEEKVGWEEIVDSRLDGRFDLQEVNEVAAFAYKCISRAPRKRPNMRDVVQVLTRVIKVRHSRKRQKKSASPSPLPPTVESGGEQTGNRSVRSENHRRDNSMDSTLEDYYLVRRESTDVDVFEKCKPNSLPALHKMHVKFGDTVKVISGRDKGKIGEVTKIFTHNSTIVIKDVNLKTKHMKSREEGEPGQILKIEAPIHSSNVMLHSKEKEVVSRVGHKVLEDGHKVRYLILTGELIDTVAKWKQLKEAKDKETTQAAVASAS